MTKQNNEGLSTTHKPKRVYIDGEGFKVHRLVEFKEWRLSQIKDRVRHATNWSVGPYTPVRFENGLLIR